MTSIKLAMLLGPLILSDIGQRNAGAYLGPIRDLDCTKDGGLWCSRDSGTAIGSIACASATSTTPGCVSTTAQTWSGDKTLTGTLKAVVVDAGAGNFGQVDLRGSTITSTNGASTFTLQSNAADSTTSATVPAMNFALGADITNSDLAWCFTDSFGNQRLCGTEAGTWTYAAHATGTGAPTVSGGNFSSTMGNGGVASGATPAGPGGSYIFTTGAGGASNGTATGGNGGTVSMSSGGGGASSGTQKGGGGGTFALICGNGGGGQAGGAFSVSGGQGGAASASWAAGAGGAISLTSGTGGIESTSAAAGGGNLTAIAGAGGAAVAGTAGTGGALTLRGGAAGAANAGTGNTGGAVVLDTGASTGAAAAPTMSIGAANAGTITMGRSLQTVVMPGFLLVQGSGGASVAMGSAGLAVGASGASMSDSRTCTLTVNPGLIGANVCATDTTGTCTGSSTTDPVACAIPAALENGLIASCWISAAGTMKVRLCNHTAGGITPASATYGLRYFH